MICFADSANNSSSGPENSNGMALLLALSFVLFIEMFTFKKMEDKEGNTREILVTPELQDSLISPQALESSPQIYEFKVGLFNKYIYSQQHIYDAHSQNHWLD